MKMEETSRKGSVVVFVPAPALVIHEDAQRLKQAGEQEASSRRGEESHAHHRFQQEPLSMPFPRTAYCGMDVTEPYAHQVDLGPLQFFHASAAQLEMRPRSAALQSHTRWKNSADPRMDQGV